MCVFSESGVDEPNPHECQPEERCLGEPVMTLLN